MANNKSKAGLADSEMLDVMTGTGHFEKGNVKFEVTPIYLDEIVEYINAKLIIPAKVNADGEEIPEKQRVQALIYSFYKVDENGDIVPVPDNENQAIIWIEKKFRVNGKPVKFYDLEKKYGLSKVDIADMLVYLNEFSGF